MGNETVGKPKVNVYVFGAGASVDVGGPITKEFVAKGVEILCNNDIYEVSEKSFFKVLGFIDLLYNKNLVEEVKLARKEGLSNIPDSFTFLYDVSIEELLSFVDIGIANRERDTWLPYSYPELQSALYDFIFETLDELQKPYYNTRNCYDKLVNNIIDVNDRNCFITFNYDLFLDKVVTINNHKFLGDYNLNFAKVDDTFPGYEERFLKGNRKSIDVDILKLHGSLNWARCPECEQISLYYYNNYRSILNTDSTCCRVKLKPILVPPTFRKNIESYGVGGLWDKAEEMLCTADNIVIIGYSFPDVDIEANWLLKRSVSKGKKRPNLILVNPNSEVRNKIIKFFGDTVSCVTEFNDFEQYCESHYLQHRLTTAQTGKGK